MNRIYLLGAIVLLAGCLREELPVEPTPRGDAVQASVNMQVNYDDQIWYDLSTQRVVAKHPRIAWDIGLGSSDTADRVILNTSCAMQAAVTDETDFEAVTALGDRTFYPDHPTGQVDSLAFRGDWIGKVVLLDLGYSATGARRGQKKIQFLEVNDQLYRFQYANLDGSDAQEVTVTRDPTYNFQTYSLRNHEAYQVEPPKE
ncbi:MAG: HmuY family protein, partial [Bacteroidota bacterium]